MKNLDILIVEGNLKEENYNFTKAGIKTHTESLTDSLNYLDNNLLFDIANPSSDKNLDEVKKKLPKYCLLYTSPSPRDRTRSRMPSSA